MFLNSESYFQICKCRKIVEVSLKLFRINSQLQTCVVHHLTINLSVADNNINK
jgi:hypothetical protein